LQISADFETNREDYLLNYGRPPFLSKLKKSVANFPKQTDKKIILAVWCKNNKIKNGEHLLINAEDVLAVLK